MILNCRQVSRLVSEGMDRELPAGKRLGIRVHFLICRGCRGFQGRMAFLRRAMRNLADDANSPRS